MLQLFPQQNMQPRWDEARLALLFPDVMLSQCEARRRQLHDDAEAYLPMVDVMLSQRGARRRQLHVDAVAELHEACAETGTGMMPG